MKKMLSLVLALAMVLSLTTMVWAAGPVVINVETNAELVEALKTNAEEVVINLSAAPTDGTEKFTINLSSRTLVPHIKSLTINGTDHTKVEFYKNVAANLFGELTINNCEILKNTAKGWGHLIYSSGHNCMHCTERQFSRKVLPFPY